MICTKEVYDNLLKFYYDNKSRLKELGREDVFLRCMFLLKNIEWHKDLITSIQVNITNKVTKDILEVITHDDLESDYEEIVLYCVISHGDYEEYLELRLHEEPHYDGYCDCTPSMEGYYEEHACCGRGCDYQEPTLVPHYLDYGYKVSEYREYMYFDFLREIHGQEALVKNNNRVRLLNLVSDLERELEKAKKELKETIDK